MLHLVLTWFTVIQSTFVAASHNIWQVISLFYDNQILSFPSDGMVSLGVKAQSILIDFIFYGSFCFWLKSSSLLFLAFICLLLYALLFMPSFSCLVYNIFVVILTTFRTHRPSSGACLYTRCHWNKTKSRLGSCYIPKISLLFFFIL